MTTKLLVREPLHVARSICIDENKMGLSGCAPSLVSKVGTEKGVEWTRPM